MRLSFLSSFFLLGFCFGAVCNAQSCQTTEVPVGAIGITGDPFRGLNAQDFVPSKGSASVKSLKFDDGPRRILIVVDAAGKLSSNTRRAEMAVVQSLIGAARPEDSLALITARGPGGMVKFGDARAGLVPALSQADAGHSKEGVLDAAMEGMGWFSEHQPGDAIVLVAADLDGNHKTNAKALAKAAAEHHIRVFGLALGPVLARSTVAGGSQTSTTSQGLAWTEPLTGAQTLETGDENFFPLTTNSGGVVVGVANGSSSGSYNMENKQFQQLVAQRGHQIFAMIASFYRLEIESPQLSHPQGWKLDVSEGVRKAAPKMLLLYPHELGPC